MVDQNELLEKKIQKLENRKSQIKKKIDVYDKCIAYHKTQIQKNLEEKKKCLDKTDALSKEIANIKANILAKQLNVDLANININQLIKAIDINKLSELTSNENDLTPNQNQNNGDVNNEFIHS